MFFKNLSRRSFALRMGGTLVGFTVLGECWLNAQSSARLIVFRTSSGVRIVATVTSMADLWELQKSSDGGKTWVALTDNKPIVIGQGRLRWNLPMSANESVGIFRLRLVTEATMEVAGVTYQLPANGESLFTAMKTNPELATFNSLLYGWGQLVTEIKGTRKGGGLHWFLDVNGQMPKIGDSLIGSLDYIHRPGDKIKWKLDNNRNL